MPARQSTSGNIDQNQRTSGGVPILMLEHFSKITAVDPPAAGGALDEMLGLVRDRLSDAPSARALGSFHHETGRRPLAKAGAGNARRKAGPCRIRHLVSKYFSSSLIALGAAAGCPEDRPFAPARQNTRYSAPPRPSMMDRIRERASLQQQREVVCVCVARARPVQTSRRPWFGIRRS